MAILSHRALGTGPDVVVLIHGVGVDATSFETVARRVAQHHTVVVPDRRGYRSSGGLPPASSLAMQVDDLEQLVDAIRAPESRTAPGLTVVGVSGGATLALALAIRWAEHGHRGSRVLAHEPLIGALAPALATRVTDAYRRTLEHDPTQASHYVAELVGPATWARQDEEARARVAAQAWVIAAEVPTFLAFHPSLDDLRLLRGVPFITSIGSESPAARWETVEVLRATAGVRTAVIDGAGHLPQIDAPHRFADLVIATAASREPAAATSPRSAP
jgi:pimeloyl-ACP methyl ester carboxylesterase